MRVAGRSGQAVRGGGDSLSYGGHARTASSPQRAQLSRPTIGTETTGPRNNLRASDTAPGCVDEGTIVLWSGYYGWVRGLVHPSSLLSGTRASPPCPEKRSVRPRRMWRRVPDRAITPRPCPLLHLRAASVRRPTPHPLRATGRPHLLSTPRPPSPTPRRILSTPRGVSRRPPTPRGPHGAARRRSAAAASRSATGRIARERGLSRRATVTGRPCSSASSTASWWWGR